MSSTSDALFPTPAAPPNLVAPARWPGITPKNVAVLKKLLKENHERWHIFFNDRGFHNHIIHRLLAVWALGGDAAVIEACYKFDSSYQRHSYASPGPITAENFKEHLGEHDYWDAYLRFFDNEVREIGMRNALEKYIFSREYNFEGKGADEEQTRMLDRFVSGILHPVIHTGYGFEFGLPGIVSEGLAQTALHKSSFQTIINPDFFDKLGVKAFSPVAALAKELDITTPAKLRVGTETKSTHVLTIVARMLKDTRFAEVKFFDRNNTHTETKEKFGSIIREYIDQWDTDTSDPKEVTRKYEELVWTNVVLYGVCGFQQTTNDFKNDFVLMHLVTSVLFLPSLLAFLSPPSQALLFRSYLAASLVAWIGQGRPRIDIKHFYSASEDYPLPSGSLPIPHESTLPTPDADPNRVKAVTPNPWFPIIEDVLVDPNEHHVKLQRALAHFSNLYGTREAGAKDGGLDGAAEELEGAELLDGSLFIRVAGLTMKKMGRVREGEAPGRWDFSGFFDVEIPKIVF